MKPASLNGRSGRRRCGNPGRPASRGRGGAGHRLFAPQHSDQVVRHGPALLHGGLGGGGIGVAVGPGVHRAVADGPDVLEPFTRRSGSHRIQPRSSVGRSRPANTGLGAMPAHQIRVSASRRAPSSSIDLAGVDFAHRGAQPQVDAAARSLSAAKPPVRGPGWAGSGRRYPPG